MYLVARDLLGAGVGVAACAMGFAGADRMVLHTGLNPYFNQTWGYMAMPFALVLAWWLVQPDEPPGDRRRTGGLLAIFLGVCALAYPLALPIAAMPLVVFLWRERRRRIREGLPVPRIRNLYKGPRSLLWMIPAVLVLLVPLNGVSEKLNAANQVIFDPGHTLINWAADLRAFIPMTYFINLPDHGLFRLLMIVIVVLAFRELRRHQPRAVYIGLGLVLGLGLYFAGSFRQRDYGYYFHFKILAFIAPLLLVIAAVHLGRFRRVGPVVLAAFAVATATAAKAELDVTGRQLGKPTVELGDWVEELPRDASVRLDMTRRPAAVGQLLHRRPPDVLEAPAAQDGLPARRRARVKADYVARRLRLPAPAGGGRPGAPPQRRLRPLPPRPGDAGHRHLLLRAEVAHHPGRRRLVAGVIGGEGERVGRGAGGLDRSPGPRG